MLHAHVRKPGRFVHVAFALHPPFCAAHSSMSAHVTPSPWKPALHVHVREPGTFVHVASAAQPPFALKHSFTSMQP
jgi:hypothetical protein